MFEKEKCESTIVHGWVLYEIELREDADSAHMMKFDHGGTARPSLRVYRELEERLKHQLGCRRKIQFLDDACYILKLNLINFTKNEL